MQGLTVSLILFFFLTGCAVFSPNAITDNRQWVAVSCSGFVGWEACHQSAARACPNGYDVANQLEKVREQHRSMEYACK